MPINKILTIINTSHEAGNSKALVIEGTNGSPSVKIEKLSRVSLDLYSVQLDDKFSDTLYLYKTQGYVKVLLDGIELTEDSIGELKYTLPLEDSGTDELVKVGVSGTPDYLNPTYFSQSALANITPVEKISDSAISTSGLWSSTKISSELGDKADADHTHFFNPRVVFKEEFIGNGSSNTFTLTGSILNGSFSDGSWIVGKVLNTFSSDITGLDNKPTYDGTNIFTRHRVSTVSINGSGVVTLDFIPRNAVHFYIWYWYEIQDGDVIDDYIREEFVADMEASTSSTAAEVPVDSSGFSNNLGVGDTSVQSALSTIDSLGTLPTGGAAGQVLVKDSSSDFDVKWHSMILYGTGDPPSAVGVDNGTLYIRYID